MADNEKQLEQDIESFLISPAGGWQKAILRRFWTFAAEIRCFTAIARRLRLPKAFGRI